jgi:hypothetical protein
MLGGNFRISNRFAFVTDNMFIQERGGGISLISGALRTFGMRYSCDLGLATAGVLTAPLASRQFLPLPVISFSYCISCLYLNK